MREGDRESGQREVSTAGTPSCHDSAVQSMHYNFLNGESVYPSTRSLAHKCCHIVHEESCPTEGKQLRGVGPAHPCPYKVTTHEVGPHSAEGVQLA